MWSCCTRIATLFQLKCFSKFTMAKLLRVSDGQVREYSGNLESSESLGDVLLKPTWEKMCRGSHSVAFTSLKIQLKTWFRLNFCCSCCLASRKKSYTTFIVGWFTRYDCCACDHRMSLKTWSSVLTQCNVSNKWEQKQQKHKVVRTRRLDFRHYSLVGKTGITNEKMLSLPRP